jgi:hypothetical protein
MNEYIISHTLTATDRIPNGGYNYDYDFKIDTHGNVFVKHGRCYYNESTIRLHEYFSIVDNIQIPEYMMEIIVDTLKNHYAFRSNRSEIERRRYVEQHASIQKAEMFLDLVKKIKKTIKEMTDKPQNNMETQTQLELYINKTKILEEEVENVNKKIKNIQTAYFDAINDNEKMKEENKSLIEKIGKLEEQIKKGNIVYVEIPNNTNYPNFRIPINQENTGTLPNAANRMVFNKYKGIYEPEEDEL